MSGDTFACMLSGIWLNIRQCTGHLLKTNSCVCAQPLTQAGLSVTSWTVAHQAPPPVEFSKPERCSGLPFPFPGDLSDLGIEPASPVSPALAGGFLPLSRLGSPTKESYLPPCQLR